MIMKKTYGKQSGYTGLSQLFLDGARLGGWRGDTRRLILTQVEELDERMQKLTHKLENARRDFVDAHSFPGRLRLAVTQFRRLRLQARANYVAGSLLPLPLPPGPPVRLA